MDGKLVDCLIKMQAALGEAGIESAVIGAMAVAVWGQPRYTGDVDLRVLLDRDEAQRLLDAIPSDCIPIGGSPMAWLERNAMVFVTTPSGVKVDLLLADTGFDEEVVQRAQVAELLPGKHARVCTAEDVLIYKMISTREKDYIDVEGIVRRQGVRLDAAYVLRWLREFELAIDDSTLVSRFQRLCERYCKP